MRLIPCVFGLVCLSIAVPVTAQTVSVGTLDGQTLSGELTGLTHEGIGLLVNGEERTMPADVLMQVDFVPQNQKPASEIAPVTVTLSSQSSLSARSAAFDGTSLTLESPIFGELKFPVRDLRAIRFGSLDDKIAESWRDLGMRNSRDDLLIFRKGDILDYVSGAIGKIDAMGVSIRVRDRDLNAPLDRVFGIVFAQRGETPRSQGIGVTTIHGDTFKAQTFALKSGQLELTIVGGISLKAPLTSFSAFDYGGGRIRFLTDLPADEKDSKSPVEEYPVVWFTSPNAPAGSGGREPLLIGDRSTRKGLWLHGGAVVRYRLNREFSRFKCLAGFELSHVAEMPRFEPRVRLVIAGDGKEIYSHEFSWNDAPQPLELAVGDVRDLVIRVESLGKSRGILEHFALGDAQLIQ